MIALFEFVIVAQFRFCLKLEHMFEKPKKASIGLVSLIAHVLNLFLPFKVFLFAKMAIA